MPSFVVCASGHRQWALLSTPCVWCAAVESGYVDSSIELGGRIVTFPVPLTAEDALALSWPSWEQP